MKVRLNEIPEEGLTLSERFDPAAMGLDTPELKFVAPIQVTATFKKERDTVMVDVLAAGQQELVCGRCLTAYGKAYQGQFDLGYSLKGKWLLDVTNDIRQEILLSYPVRFLCRPDCKGLCVHCGANLNPGPCGCGGK